MAEFVPAATGRVARDIVGNREQQSSAISGRHVLTQTHSFHHRQLRSQGGPDTPANLVLVSGTGTTGEHGWIHRNPGVARALGYIVPSWAAADAWPIYRRDPYGVGWDWFTQDPEGQLEWSTSAPIVEQLGISVAIVTSGIRLFRELVATELAGS